MLDSNAQERYRSRQGVAAKALQKNGSAVLVVEDCEKRRNANLPYLCGCPADGLLFLFASAKTVLVAWDEPLARQHACADVILPYTGFGRDPVNAIVGVLESELLLQPGKNGRARSDGSPPMIALGPDSPWPMVQELLGRLGKRAGIECPGRVLSTLTTLRGSKDTYERGILFEAASVTDMLIDLVAEQLLSGEEIQEYDLALLLETKARKLGAEGMSFPVLAAGPKRSYAIHTHPPAGNGPLFGQGLSIVDFGIWWRGYASDVTITVANKPNSQQQELLDLVSRATAVVESMLAPGLPVSELARAVQELFRSAGREMPHSLGHGVGLEVHEYPILKESAPADQLLEPGMILSIEPGLYDPALGGVRLENMYLILAPGETVSSIDDATWSGLDGRFLRLTNARILAG